MVAAPGNLVDEVSMTTTTTTAAMTRDAPAAQSQRFRVSPTPRLLPAIACLSRCGPPLGAFPGGALGLFDGGPPGGLLGGALGRSTAGRPAVSVASDWAGGCFSCEISDRNCFAASDTVLLSSVTSMLTVSSTRCFTMMLPTLCKPRSSSSALSFPDA